MANPTAACKISQNGNGRPAPVTLPLPPIGEGYVLAKARRKAQGARNNRAPGPEGPGPLPTLAGGSWSPAWATRPGAFTCLSGVEGPAIKCTWVTIHSLTGDDWHPCCVRRERLADTDGISLAKVKRYLKQLNDAGLVWSLGRGMDPDHGHWRGTARWALDPWKADLWYPLLRDRRIPALAERDRRSGAWLERTLQELEDVRARSGLLAARLWDEAPTPPPERRRPRAERPSTPARAHALTVAHSEPRPWSIVSHIGEGEFGGGDAGAVKMLKKNGRAKPDDVVLKKGPPTKGDGVVLTSTLPDSVGKRADSTGMAAHHRNGSERVCKPALDQGEFEVRSREAAEDTMGTTMDSQTSLDLPSSRLSYVDPGDQV